MRKIFVFLLSVGIVCPALSDCVSTESITKCARIPGNDGGSSFRFIPYRGDYTDNSWRFIRHDLSDGELVPGHYYSGTNATAYKQGSGEYEVTCYMTSPFVGTITAALDETFDSPYEACAHLLPVRVQILLSDISRLSDEKCPDGFYTVPYDISCGEDLVNTTGIPNCSNDISGEFCLITSTVPCASGITTLRSSSGLAFKLWAEKYTEPSLCISYNDMVCYVNLESGSANDSINIEYNGVIYHAVN